ncbi:hypothetical protein K443DRAFT_15255 [Laccaria amethystina LaAM-08-1]|uniref:Uncharacterized protein n=1 Tax=Laccaria amethystina LaAM-08-1 TaxID=1095629 RepID=A0A0C9WYI0_9AGAR|nr:hypothetical protein K443DRAFT_15255 [Laccaria amethystina LaAM-08-1]
MEPEGLRQSSPHFKKLPWSTSIATLPREDLRHLALTNCNFAPLIRTVLRFEEDLQNPEKLIAVSTSSFVYVFKTHETQSTSISEWTLPEALHLMANATPVIKVVLLHRLLDIMGLFIESLGPRPPRHSSSNPLTSEQRAVVKRVKNFIGKRKTGDWAQIIKDASHHASSAHETLESTPAIVTSSNSDIDLEGSAILSSALNRITKASLNLIMGNIEMAAVHARRRKLTSRI